MVSFIGKVLINKTARSKTFRVTIPPTIIQAMDLKAGDLIEIEVHAKVKQTETP